MGQRYSRKCGDKTLDTLACAVLLDAYYVLSSELAASGQSIRTYFDVANAKPRISCQLMLLRTTALSTHNMKESLQLTHRRGKFHLVSGQDPSRALLISAPKADHRPCATRQSSENTIQEDESFVVNFQSFTAGTHCDC